MTAVADIRSTVGWSLCPHARQKARIRGVSVRSILEVIAAPEVTYSAFDYGHGRFVYQRGDLAIVVIPERRTVVTVLWRRGEQWTDEEFAQRSIAPPARRARYARAM
ncbi:hypothetical protein [Cellulomonas fimi]|uniref:DUF4258 domain-containing protein n=1 Tax=Cellulomonas fimi TaxID=1708 RepID=A0A7Y0LW62_CELFI|nr:hypothetical protein [Cellulomonas fimi]NMR19180.1 hypothetical protein [Cellulomonas fimi]